MESVCIIPARGGSKLIPQKNVKIFYGMPIIAWAIDCAVESTVFERVILSTDEDEITTIDEMSEARFPKYGDDHLGPGSVV